MQVARDQHKSFTDKRRKPLEFQVVDKVMLKIIAKVGPIAYTLELPQELTSMHNTFHISNLKKYLSDESLVIPLDEVQVDDKLYFIVDYCRRIWVGVGKRSGAVRVRGLVGPVAGLD
ncbi:hypothetical protein Tco_1067903 [Tanacetum coccineum]|uniref:Tf2-1-like SH3-like domain-containing protein n=1 Tax=Tanacetum coccineum TaxID=301880 RepID=A0ABQ5HFM5_9ASTR